VTLKPFRFTLVAGAAIVLFALVAGSTIRSQAQAREGGFGVGVPDSLVRKYVAFRAGQLAGSAPQVLRVSLGYVKGLSRSFTAMAGELALSLESGAFNVSLSGLTPQQTYSVWLVDAAETEEAQVLPDTVVRLTTFHATRASGIATGTLNPAALGIPDGFSIDRVVVAVGTASPAEPLATGSVNVFQKIFYRRVSLVNESTQSLLLDERTRAPRFASLVPDLAAETDANLVGGGPASFGLSSTFSAPVSPAAVTASPAAVRLDRLISRGATLFFDEPFGGNGRTCGTCHPASNNFTIDPAFIRTLPGSDPLFVAEFNPALAKLEKPQLMRRFGLILENLDGLTDPTRKFVMRGVPHTLGMQVSLERDQALTGAPAEMTGWSGDGAPGSGSLRDFAVGAVTQHFTKRLDRVPGQDFIRPTEHQLDAMEAFQLSLGRSEDFNLEKITFRDANVQTGRSLFMKGTGDPAAGGTCSFCHNNGGALSSLNGQNMNFDTRVERSSHPGQSVEPYPGDGGFGQTANAAGTFGNGTFNISPVVEAADTAPFFHNNVVNTLEEVVTFYSGPLFNDQQPDFARISLNRTQIEQIADFMRALNVLQNVDVARRELREILALTDSLRREQDTRLQTAYEETGDSIKVLTEGRIYPAVVTHLVAARTLIVQAKRNTNAEQRRTLVQRAITSLGQGRGAVATVAP
jgi:cytochrome c peroxidase